jgi:predicted ABC-type ATPase
MMPRILRADGSVIYGNTKVDPETVIQKGMVSYYRDMTSATRDARAGSKPLVIRPIGVYKQEAVTSDVVLSQKDAEKLIAENERSGFLKKLNVVIVTE